MSPEWNLILYRLLDASVRAVLFAGVVALILASARIRSNSVRHAAWTAVLLAMLLMPILTSVLPCIPIALPVPVVAIQDQIRSREATSSSSAILNSNTAQETVRKISHEQFPSISHDRRPVWPFAAVVFYCAGVLILLSRALWGWREMSRILRKSRPVAREILIRPELRNMQVPLYESEIVAVPLTAGILSPRIILPEGWSKWPAHKLGAVLAHELSHVRRHDTLIAPLSYLNRCLFWFHPFAWWLERKLATVAELASDEDAVLSLGESRLYARVLLDMAQAVRRRGGRLAWHSVGVNGNGFLGQRVDRVLRGALFQDISRIRKAIVAVGCAAAIFFVVACRQKSPAAGSEENPKLAVQQTQQRPSFWAKRLRILTDPVNAPLEFGAGTGVQGLDVDVGNEMAKDLGIEAKWVKAPSPGYKQNRLRLVIDNLFQQPSTENLSDYEHLFELLKKGEAEILLSAIAIDRNKSAGFQFSKPYYDTGDVIARQRNRFDITDLASLSGKKVGVASGRPGDAFMAAQKTASSVSIAKYATLDDALGALNRGEIDAVVGDEPMITYSSIKSFHNTTTIPILINKYQYAAVVKKGKTDLLAKINATVDRLKSTGALNRWDEAWLGKVRKDRALEVAALRSRNPRPVRASEGAAFRAPASF
jgi:ABC-type amino acid transport substrate-binding protein/Zn-dependent protease with chaperone function